MTETTQHRLIYVVIAMLVAFAAFMLWRNWAKVTGAVGIGGAAGAGSGGGPSTFEKIKNTLIPGHSFDPRKGSIANPVGYVYNPVKNAVTSAWNTVF